MCGVLKKRSKRQTNGWGSAIQESVVCASQRRRARKKGSRTDTKAKIKKDEITRAKKEEAKRGKNGEKEE